MEACCRLMILCTTQVAKVISICKIKIWDVLETTESHSHFGNKGSELKYQYMYFFFKNSILL